MTSVNSDGRAYGRPTGEADLELVEVGPGTASGELLRRYWHPIGRSDEATTVPSTDFGTSAKSWFFTATVREPPDFLSPVAATEAQPCISGEWRTKVSAALTTAGSLALTASVSTSLVSPTEAATRRRIVNPGTRWVEYNGLLFTYMGPADKQPVFPRYDIFDDLDEETEEIVIVDHFAFGGPNVAPCNWFQTHENAMDPYHVFILHNAISGPSVRSEAGDLAPH